jgi:hypothetical protein
VKLGVNRGGAGANLAPAPRYAVLVVSVAVAALLAVPGAIAGSTSKSQPCPASPSGWKAAGSNPQIFGAAQQPGQHHTMVSCSYEKGARELATVIAEYADLDDPNPNTDFYYGCSAKRSQAWDLVHRTYFVSNPGNWSYVEFTDPGHQLPNSSVQAFERVAKSLLSNVAPLAHDCKLNTTTPTVMQHLYLFGFEFFASSPDFKAFGGVPARSTSNILIPAGKFTATSGADSTIVSKIISAYAPPFGVTVIDHGKTYKMKVRVNGGGNLVLQPPLQRFNLNLRVAQSNYPKCRAGSRGTISIVRSQYMNAPNAPASVRVRLCGAAFAHGKYRGTALLIGG